MVGDGAPWIWNLALDHFYDSHQIVDWYHAAEHLAAAARLIKGEGTAAAKRWFKAQATTLFQGHIDRLVLAIEAEAQCQPAIAETLRKAERLFSVRSAIMSGRFDERWRQAYNSPPN